MPPPSSQPCMPPASRSAPSSATSSRQPTSKRPSLSPPTAPSRARYCSTSKASIAERRGPGSPLRRRRGEPGGVGGGGGRGHAGAHCEDRAGLGIRGPLRRGIVLARRGDKECPPVGTPECAARHLRCGHVNSTDQLPVGPVALHRAPTPEGDP